MSSKMAPRLGRGLAALLADAAPPEGASGNSVRMLPVELLAPGPFQPRREMDVEALEGLAESIRASGILQPILVRAAPGDTEAYQIIAGERRWRAAQLAALHEVPCLVRGLSDAEAMAAGLVENLQRQDLNAMEEAEGLQRLAEDFALRQEDVARVVGKSRSHVANILRLLHLPAAVQAAVRRGELSAGHARALLGRDDAERLAQLVVQRGLSVRQTEALTRPARMASARVPARDFGTGAAAQELSERLGLRVEIMFDGRAGSVRVICAEFEQLERVLELLRA